MSYQIATRTRTRLLTYAVCDNIEQAREQLIRYSHVWRVHIYQIDDKGNVSLVK